MLAKSLPCESEAFRSAAERGVASNVTGELVCTRHGLSVFPTYASCEHQRRTFPRLGPHIVFASLHPEHGVIAQTPTKNPQHHTWWPYEDVVRESLFSPVSDGGEQS